MEGKRGPEIPSYPFSTPVYDKQVKNIGGLDDEIVALVVMFYGYLAYINSLQAMRQQYVDAEKAPEFNDQYAKSLDRLVGDFGSKFDGAFDRYNIKGLRKPEAVPNQPLQPTGAAQSVSPKVTASAGGPGG